MVVEALDRREPASAATSKVWVVRSGTLMFAVRVKVRSLVRPLSSVFAPSTKRRTRVIWPAPSRSTL
jgi:hypothetical protein